MTAGAYMPALMVALNPIRTSAARTRRSIVDPKPGFLLRSGAGGAASGNSAMPTWAGWAPLWPPTATRRPTSSRAADVASRSCGPALLSAEVCTLLTYGGQR